MCSNVCVLALGKLALYHSVVASRQFQSVGLLQRENSCDNLSVLLNDPYQGGSREHVGDALIDWLSDMLINHVGSVSPAERTCCHHNHPLISLIRFYYWTDLL